MGLNSEKNSINRTHIWVAIIVGAAIFGYGMVNFISKENERTNQTEIQRKVSIENKAKCQRDGQDFYEKQKTRNQQGHLTWVVVEGNQSYGYNKELNTCLIAWESSSSINNLDPVFFHYITDVFSNKDLYIWSEALSKNSPEMDDLQNSEEGYNQMLQHYGL